MSLVWTDLILLGVHDGVDNLEDGLQYEHVEKTSKGFALGIGALGTPLASGRVEEVIAPKLGQKLVFRHTELFSVVTTVPWVYLSGPLTGSRVRAQYRCISCSTVINEAEWIVKILRNTPTVEMTLPEKWCCPMLRYVPES